jgi:pimeloyl-ACP methyl ester carboxylesterase
MASTHRRSFGRTAVLVAGLGIGGAAVGVLAAERRWDRADDPTGGRPLEVGDGTESVCVTEDGARLAVLELGTGSAGDVVLPHCWMGSRRFWGPVADRLVRRGHRVVIYDERGHGASTTGREGHSIEALGDDLDAVLRHADVRDAVVAGHSLGGMAAQTFLVRHPGTAADRVRGVVLVSTACEFLVGAARMRQTAWAFGARMTPLYAHPALGPLLMRGTVGRRPVLGHLRALSRTIAETRPDVRVDFLLAMADMDLTAQLASTSVPVIVLVGERDTVTAPQQAKSLADAITGARLEEVPDAGHMLVWEAPDRIVDAIEELHARSSASASETAVPTRS